MHPTDVSRPLQTSKRIQRTRPAVVDDVIKKYGQNVRFNFAPGAPFFGVSSAVWAEMAASHIRNDDAASMSRYGDVLGTLDLRQLWANVLAQGYGEKTQFNMAEMRKLEEIIPTHELMISAGANQGFVNVVLALCDHGDEVLLILPYYFSHFNALIMTGVQPICVPVSEKSFLPDLRDIEGRITEQTKALVVVNPGNPSGKVYSKEVMESIAQLCRDKDIWLIIDEAYREFVFSGEANISFSPTADDGTIHIYTASKAYGLAGWRIGAILYPKRLSDDMRKVQDTIPTHASKFSEKAAYEALKFNPLAAKEGSPSNISQLNEVRRIFIDALEAVYMSSKLADCFVPPDGAFYLFLPYETAANRGKLCESDDWIIVDRLALEYGVLVTPGFTFGMPGYIRVSYGCVELSVAQLAAEALANGMKKIVQS